MFTDNHEISGRQIRRMGILENIPVLIVFAPFVCTAYGTGILSLIAGLVLVFIYVLIMKKYGECFKKQGVSYSADSSSFTALINIIRYSVRIGFLSFVFARAIKSFLMYGISESVLLITLIVVCFYGSFGDMERRGRLMELLFMWMIIPLVIAGIIGIFNLDWSSLSINTIAQDFTNRDTYAGACLLLCTASTSEFVLFLSERPAGTKKNIMMIIFVSLFSCALGYLVIVGTLGMAWVSEDIISGLNVMEAVTNNIRGIRRIDYLVLTFFIVGIFAVISGHFFREKGFMENLMARVGGVKKDSRKTHIVCLSLVFILAMASGFFFKSMDTPYQIFAYYMLFLDLPLSLIMPLYMIIKKKKSHVVKYAVMFMVISLSLGTLSGCNSAYTSVENRDFASSLTLSCSETGSVIYEFTIDDLSEYGGNPGDKIGEITTYIDAESMEDAQKKYKEDNENALDVGHLSEIIIKTDEEKIPDIIMEHIYPLRNNPVITKAVKVIFPGGEEVLLRDLIKENSD